MRWSGRFHIVNRQTRTSLESHYSRDRADHFCEAVNIHERNNNRPEVYAVEEHAQDWRSGEEVEL